MGVGGSLISMLEFHQLPIPRCWVISAMTGCSDFGLKWRSTYEKIRFLKSGAIETLRSYTDLTVKEIYMIVFKLQGVEQNLCYEVGPTSFF